MAAATVFLLLMVVPVVILQDSSFLFQRVMNALENMVTYYKMNYRDLNVDGLFGLRVVEGHMESILQEYSSGKYQNLSVDSVNRIKKMLSEATLVCRDAIEFVKQDDEEYYQSMSFVVGHSWSHFEKPKQVVPDLKWHPSYYLQHNKKILDESVSDECMSELMGSKGKEKCNISDQCVKIMTTKGLSGYGITHQLLYTMLAEKAGCSKHIDSLYKIHINSTKDFVRLEFCTNNLIEMTDIIHGHYKGVIVPNIQDLFMEQQFICPSLGYYQFLSKKYLEDILTWQKPNGCFGHLERPVTLKPDNKKFVLNKNMMKTRQNHVQNVNEMNINPKFKLLNLTGTNNVLLSKTKVTESVQNTKLDNKFLKHVPVSLNNSLKLYKKTLNNVTLTNNANVVMQDGQSLVEKYPGYTNIPKKYETPVSSGFKQVSPIYSQTGRQLLDKPFSFGARQEYKIGQHSFKNRKLQAEKRMGDNLRSFEKQDRL